MEKMVPGKSLTKFGGNLMAVNEIQSTKKLNFEGLIYQMESIIKLTEEYYEVVHQSIPVIERNMELTNQETSILITYFLESGNSSDGEVFLISDTLQDIKVSFEKISDSLLGQNEIKEMLKIILASDQSELSFDSFLGLIKDVEKKLRQVNQISLNSIIFSSKLGQKGVGFAVVSDFIHQTSVGLEKEFSNINNSLEDIVNWYTSFRKVIGEIIDNQTIAVRDYIKTLDAHFLEVIRFLSQVKGILSSLIDNTDYVLTPFQELMVLIQRQDIVRQSIENTVKCLQEIDAKYQEYHTLLKRNPLDKTKILDHMVFVDRGMGLVEKLAEQMGEQLNTSLEEMSQITVDMLKGLHEVKDDAQLLTEYLSPNTQLVNKEGVVDSTFNSLCDYMAKFAIILKDISSLVQQATASNCSFEGIERNLEKVVKQVEALNKIKVLAKIELARMDLIHNDLAEQISLVADDVRQTVFKNYGTFITLKSNIEKDLDYFDKIIINNQKQIDLALSDLDHSLDGLGYANRLINQAISALNKEICSFYEELSEISIKIQSIQELQRATNYLINDIKSFKGQIEEQKEHIFRTFEVEEWEEKDHELLELYKYLTGYMERFTVKAFLSADELDEGTSEGDLVLF